MSARSTAVAGGLLALLALLGPGGCDDGPVPRAVVTDPPAWTPEWSGEAEELAARLAAIEPGSEGALRVQLAFGARADLDLYVTDPFEETVYYANTPSRQSGGELVEDRRCVHQAPRVETIRFPAPVVPGRYRIGVDYPRACDPAAAPAPFAVTVDGAGFARHRGLARHQVFEPIVLEVQIAAGPTARSDRAGDGKEQ